MGSIGTASRASSSPSKSPEQVANELFNSPNNKVTSFEKQMFNEYRGMVKEGTADEDITYWIIYKDGQDVTLNPIHDSYEQYKSIDLRKVAYMQVLSGDDVTDSMGMAASQYFPNDEESQQLNAYNDQVERLFKTKWGRNH